MKDPKALFPILFASSWLGDLLLTVLAFFLAFTHDGPLSPLVFLTVGLCILAGNLLPIGSYWLFIRWRADELRAEQAEATVRVREALKRSEEVMGRLDEAEGALSKAILIARQVPERIAESLREVEVLSEKLNTLEVSSFTESLEANSSSLEELQKESQSIQKTIEALKTELSEVPGLIGKLLKTSLAQSKPKQADEDDVALGERLDLVFESLESVQDTLDGLLNRVAELSVPGASAGEPVIEDDVEEEGLDEPVEEPDPLPEEEAVEVIEEDEDGEVIEEPEPDDEPEIEQDEDDTPEQEEMSLEEDDSAIVQRPVAKDVVRLSAQAMVGISNKLYIRGDEPWLSWDEGQQMELVGIGEFAWSMDNLKEPIEVAIFLNDEIPAAGGNILLEPGKPMEIRPKFPKV